MYDSVRESWHAFSEPFEGRVPSMYLDILGLVTCGVGNLIDPVSEAVKVPFYRDSDGQRATEAEVRAAWHALKERQDLKRRGVSYARALTKLHMRDEDIGALVASRLASNEAFICKWLPAFPTIPADAQLGILSMAWAVGAGFNRKFPTFTKAALAGDWFAASAACTIREAGNPGVVPRNKANRCCFMNAHLVATHGLDRSALHWPAAVSIEVAEAARDAEKAQRVTDEDRARAEAAFVEATRDAQADDLHATLRGLSDLDEPDDGESAPPPPAGIA
jgi:GH24 family phage-related lysozyme (muramidase)